MGGPFLNPNIHQHDLAPPIMILLLLLGFFIQVELQQSIEFIFGISVANMTHMLSGFPYAAR